MRNGLGLPKLRSLDLFSGLGGLSLALEPWAKPAAYCENNEYAQGVLLSRMHDGQLPIAPIWDDVCSLRGDLLPPIDIIIGGFPCTNISVAGRGEGLEGKQSGLFFEILRLAQEIEPAFIFLENVPAIRTRGASRVCIELARLGFDLRWCTVSAAEVGAPHLRNRWFLLAAHPERLKLRDEQGRSSGPDREGQAFPRNDGSAGSPWAAPGVGLADTADSGLERQWQGLLGHLRGEPWPQGVPLPALCRGDDGLSARVDRLHALGNACIPIQAREAFMRLAGLKEVA